MICIYHSRDLDGWMSAAIVKEYCNRKHVELQLIGWDYGQPIPELDYTHEIVMVDVSFPADVMVKINKRTKLTWIDHHHSAIVEVANFLAHNYPAMRIGGKTDTTFAACELTWKYFFPEEPMPEIVRVLGRYDCFGHKGTEEEQYVLEFQYGARAVITDVISAYQRLVMALTFTEGIKPHQVIHTMGYSIYTYLCVEAKQIYAQRFNVNFDGHKFACINRERFNPVNYGIDYHADGYDGFACFWLKDGKWNFSLYNDNGKVDCSAICKKRGGGGHKGAAGFVTEYIMKTLSGE